MDSLDVDEKVFQRHLQALGDPGQGNQSEVEGAAFDFLPVLPIEGRLFGGGFESQLSLLAESSQPQAKGSNDGAIDLPFLSRLGRAFLDLGHSTRLRAVRNSKHLTCDDSPHVTRRPDAMSPEIKTCPFCAEDIKVNAVRCRFCGADLEEHQDDDAQAQPPSARRFAVRTIKKLIALASFLVAASIVGGLLLYCAYCRIGTTETTDGAAIEVSASQLQSDYAANELRADNMYRGQVLHVTGIVTKIGKNIVDDPYINLATKNGSADVHAKFQSEGNLAQLSIGQRVAVRCIGANVFAGSPILRSCTMD